MLNGLYDERYRPVTTWAARHIDLTGTMMFSASGMPASMANSLPYAVAAALGNPGRPVLWLAAQNKAHEATHQQLGRQRWVGLPQLTSPHIL